MAVCEQEKVLDISLYTPLLPDVRKQVLVEDIAGLVLEAGKLSLEERINPRKFKIKNGHVIDPKSGKEVTEELKWESTLDIVEGMGMINFYNYLVDHEDSVVICASPSEGISPYIEGRVNIGVRKRDDIEFYGIPTKLNPEELLDFVLRVSEFSDAKIPNKPDFLRLNPIPIFIPNNENIWKFLENIAPLDSNAWQAIFEGKPWEMKARSEKDAELTVKSAAYLFTEAKTPRDFVLIGAYVERNMQRLGWELDKAGCPGVFNSELLGSDNSGFTKDVFGNTRETTWEYHTGSCLVCGTSNIPVGPCKICKICEKKL
ncbi:MAG: hypothetical protein UX80_C0015G0002 [Candidatus Amesbacteria bacterium GW2011_GWA2_47_11b]|uniref:Uncharacterized protein n=1 Tax=Candidatus Amesbacteria bacterium GW2011_GWA2_47_11b TaxID=1618358 RepID=A0A0G1TTG1_9BACT|nr:MAG: hypothetical protein UX80_C0015G0002 [Candidatus Amesbacteria bacterium GW2011_GWA2_47_11b]